MNFIIIILQVLLCFIVAGSSHAHDVSKRSIFSWRKEADPKETEVALPGYLPALKVHKYNGILINPVQGPPVYISNTVPGSSPSRADRFATASLSPEDVQQLDWLTRIVTFLPDEERFHEFDYTALLPYVNLIPDDSLEKLQYVVETTKTQQKSKLLKFIAFLKSAKEKKLKPFKYAAKVGTDLFNKKKEKVQSILHFGHPSPTTEIPQQVVVETSTLPAFPAAFNPFLVPTYPSFPSYPYSNSPSFLTNSQTSNNAYNSQPNTASSQSTSFSVNQLPQNTYAAQPNTIASDSTSFSVNAPTPNAYAPQPNTATSESTSYSVNLPASYLLQPSLPTSDSALSSQSVVTHGNSFYYPPKFSQYTSQQQASTHNSNNNPAHSTSYPQNNVIAVSSPQQQSQFSQNQYPNSATFLSYHNPSFSQHASQSVVQAENELQVSQQTDVNQGIKQDEVASQKWEETYATHQIPQEPVKYVVSRYGNREHAGKPLTPADTYLSTDLTGSASETHEQINERNVNTMSAPQELKNADRTEEKSETTHPNDHYPVVSSTPKLRIPTKLYAVKNLTYVFPETSTEAKAKETETSHS